MGYATATVEKVLVKRLFELQDRAASINAAQRVLARQIEQLKDEIRQVTQRSFDLT